MSSIMINTKPFTSVTNRLARWFKRFSIDVLRMPVDRPWRPSTSSRTSCRSPP